MVGGGCLFFLGGFFEKNLVIFLLVWKYPYVGLVGISVQNDGDDHGRVLFFTVTLLKTTMTVENPPFEDVFPIENRDFSS